MGCKTSADRWTGFNPVMLDWLINIMYKAAVEWGGCKYPLPDWIESIFPHLSFEAERSLEHLVEVVEGREHLHLNFNPDRGSFVSWSAAAAAAAAAAPRQPFSRPPRAWKRSGGRGGGGGGGGSRGRRAIFKRTISRNRNSNQLKTKFSAPQICSNWQWLASSKKVILAVLYCLY